jgi:2-polyprenyl-3-methyl-5-hydroxy-6-metoxy-1,4-benzoquinol methylase
MEHRLFDPDNVPAWATFEWHLDRESVAHIDQPEHQPRMALAAQYVTDLVHALDADTVVDVGAGDGGMLSLLAPPGHVIRHGYDLCPANVTAAARRGVAVELVDAVALAAHDQFLEPGTQRAVVIATETLEHLVNPHRFLVDLYAQSGVQGIVASSPWNESAQHHYEFHLWAWDDDGYRSLFECAGWTVVRQERAGFATVIAATRGAT